MKKCSYLSLLVSIAVAGLFLISNPVAAAATAKKTTKTTKTAPAAPKPVQRVSTIAKNPYVGAIVVDAATGRVLFEDNADAKGYPASTLKLMDLLIILEKIQQRQLSLQDPVPVSAKSALTGGSQVWLKEKECFTVEDMLFALMIQSANDAAVALAEKVAGSTEAFVQLMNQKAQALGMRSTVFNSVHGLPPSPGQPHDMTTPRDFALLCRELVMKHPEGLRYTATRERVFRPNGGKTTVVMRTHNHLIGTVDGCDGLKTGYITAAGYSLAATAWRNGQRVIVYVMGSSDYKTRDAKATELISRGFAALPSATPMAPRLPTAPAAPTPAKR